MSQTCSVVCRPCPMCGRRATVVMPIDAFVRWRGGQGEHIQTAWPEADAGTRELLISGTHPACWEEMWKDEE